MIFTSMAVIQHLCSAPLARAMLPRSLAVSRSRGLSILSAAPRASLAVSQQVLLGMSEQELQQLALDLGQVNERNILFFFSVCLPRNWKKLSNM